MPPVGSGHLQVPHFTKDDYWVDYDPDNYNLREPGTDLDRQWYYSRIHRGAFGGKVENQAFMLRRLNLERNRDEDDEWGPVRLLGAGTYGRVGLWEKRNAKNIPVDELALKESVYDEAHPPTHDPEVSDIKNKPRLLREATIQSDLNWKDDRVAPHLRKYKFISDHRADEQGRYRFYLEFCRHGDLDHLRRLYRAWNHHLPEVFVWHVFHRLAVACEALRSGPNFDSLAMDDRYFDDYDQDVKDQGIVCLHLDMKPGNVLLGYEPFAPYPPDEPEIHDLPEPLLSDYGMSDYTSISDMRNPFSYWWRGTRAYKATEQLFYGAHWKSPPNGAITWIHDEKGRRLDYKHARAMQRKWNYKNPAGDISFDHSLNIYGAGATMYAVTTLSRDRRLIRVRAKHYSKYRQNGNHQVSKVRTKLPGVYSSRLRHLIHRCIDPDPANRPSQVELMDATLRGLRLAERRVRRARAEAHAAAGGDVNVTPPPLPEEKLYYRDHEINDLPLGDAPFHAQADDFEYLVRDQFVNPDIPRLKLPKTKYGRFPEDWNRPAGNWRTLYSETNRENVWFKPVN
ncbi:serine/threonine protein kinase [Capronia coronata CBS 617.96]|uniref:non-specific serine/threonine protein kinase n=1 Tax=Capronia coronata CBS 617.96 TaxID=1182541 RepID=W9YN52_9EURO|nr:serine/threonine protein kinase [Capronia coronata CBS 617.96]EXJ93968.1 serine/threonine protein kinase [Capronia coronata CBS 617.96]